MEATTETAVRGASRWITAVVIPLAACLIGAATLSDATANFDDVMKIMGVLAFIVTMFVLALGVVRQASRS